MKKNISFLISAISLLCMPVGTHAQKVEFYTPNTVRIVKDNGQPVEKKSLVVIASPEKVKVSQTKQGAATIYKSSALTVKVENGKVSFSDAKGNLLTSEGESTFTPITKGPDTGAFRVKQTFSVTADEGIYGIGLLQNGKMSQRGENRRMEQSSSKTLPISIRPSRATASIGTTTPPPISPPLPKDRQARLNSSRK